MRQIPAAAFVVAVIAPIASYANSGSTVSIGNPSNNATAAVAGTHQLEITLTAPNNVVHGAGAISASQCGTVYSPPAGKGVVLTQITYDLGSGAQGTESFGALFEAGCGGSLYDFADTSQAFEAQSHTFPTARRWRASPF